MIAEISVILSVLNVVTFFVYGIDKYKAKKGKWRTSEVTLLLLAICGGSVGAWLAMRVFHHKTMHKKFFWGIPTIILLQTAFVLRIVCNGRL